MDAFIVVALAVIGFVVWMSLSGRWQHRQWLSRFRTDKERDKRKEVAARKELIRRFPDRDPAQRIRVTKTVRNLEPGDLLRTARTGAGPVIVETPTTGSMDGTSPSFEYVVFTGLTPAIREGEPFLNVCDLDGYGSTLFSLDLDESVVAYVEA